MRFVEAYACDLNGNRCLISVPEDVSSRDAHLMEEAIEEEVNSGKRDLLKYTHDLGSTRFYDITNVPGYQSRRREIGT